MRTDRELLESIEADQKAIKEMFATLIQYLADEDEPAPAPISDMDGGHHGTVSNWPTLDDAL